jgi:hypothetical protein
MPLGLLAVPVFGRELIELVVEAEQHMIGSLIDDHLVRADDTPVGTRPTLQELQFAGLAKDELVVFL